MTAEQVKSRIAEEVQRLRQAAYRLNNLASLANACGLEREEGWLEKASISVELIASGSQPTKIPDRLTQFADQLERGEPVTVTQIERHDTPDGPMHTAKKYSYDHRAHDG